jgi:hypothetical protein
VCCGDGFCAWTETCSTCAADCGVCPYCGDGTCDATEACSTCAADCGGCPGCTATLCAAGDLGCCPGALPGAWNSVYSRCDCGGCAVSTDCAAAEVCAAGSCESAWGRTYRITAVSGAYSCAALDWDGSAVDPFVTVIVDGVAHTSPTVDDRTTVTWNYYFDAALRSTSTFGYTVYNENWSSNDVIMYLTAASVPVAWLHSGSHVSSTADGLCSTTFTFRPL